MRPEVTARKIGGTPLPLPLAERYGVTVQVAAQYIGISRSRIYELLADGLLDGKVIYGRRIVIVEFLMRMLGQAPTAQRVTNPKKGGLRTNTGVRIA